MIVFFWRTPIKINPHDEEGFSNFQPALTNESAWKGRGAEYMVIGGLLGQCAHCALEKKSDVYAIINLSASISTPETFLNTKAKCPLDVSEAVSLLVGGYLEQKIVHFFRHREAAQHWLQTWRTIKSHWQKKITFVVSNIKKNVLANYLHSVWWIIECN